MVGTVPVEEDVEEYEKKDQEFAMMEKAIGSLGEPCKSLDRGILYSKEEYAGYRQPVWIYQC